MTNEVLSYIKEKALELKNAPSCSQEAKDSVDAWLDCIGKENELEGTKKFIAELEQDVLEVDAVIGFLGSDKAKEIFGEEGASNMLAHMKEIKANGAKYCDCPACTAGKAILDKKADMLK